MIYNDNKGNLCFGSENDFAFVLTETSFIYGMGKDEIVILNLSNNYAVVK